MFHQVKSKRAARLNHFIPREVELFRRHASLSSSHQNQHGSIVTSMSSASHQRDARLWKLNAAPTERTKCYVFEGHFVKGCSNHNKTRSFRVRLVDVTQASSQSSGQRRETFPSSGLRCGFGAASDPREKKEEDSERASERARASAAKNQTAKHGHMAAHLHMSLCGLHEVKLCEE